MRKNQTLLIVGILLLASTAVAQGQDEAVYQVVGSAVTAREGGGAEATGSVVLSRIAGTMNPTDGIVTVQYSAPVAKGQTADGLFDVTPMEAGEVAIDDDGVVTITLAGNSPVIILKGIRVDVREVTGEITAAVSGDGENAIVAGTVTVISSIYQPVAIDAGSSSTSVLTRGTPDDGDMKSIKIQEGFSNAFTGDVGLQLVIEGLPEKAELAISAVGKAATGAEPDAPLSAGIAGDITLGPDTIVMDGVPTDSHIVVGTGKDIGLDIEFGDDAAPSNTKKETLTLMLTLVANSGVDDLALPLMGDVRVSVTMTPTKAATATERAIAYFTENFVPADGAEVFKFEPASCTLLFPYAAVVSAADWNTGIAISNPSAFTDTPLSGDLTFTLFPNDGEMFMHSTDGMSTGEGLDEDGSLPAGKTYTVLLSEVLSDAGMPGDFIGHLYVRTNFTGCRGVGWITNWTTVNQAYLPYFGDNLDEGSVPANNTKPVGP